MTRSTPSDAQAAMTRHTRTRERAPRGQGGRLREEILTATEELLTATHDPDAVSIRGICHAVGVTAPSIYLHFADKDTLVVEVCRRIFADFDAALETAAVGVDDPLESLRRRGRAYFDFGMRYPEHYRVLFMGRRGDQPPPGPEAGGDAFDHLVEAVTRCIDQGAFAPAAPVVVASTIWAALHGVTSLMISMPSFPWPDTMIDDACAAQIRAHAAH